MPIPPRPGESIPLRAPELRRAVVVAKGSRHTWHEYVPLWYPSAFDSRLRDRRSRRRPCYDVLPRLRYLGRGTPVTKSHLAISRSKFLLCDWKKWRTECEQEVSRREMKDPDLHDA